MKRKIVKVCGVELSCQNYWLTLEIPTQGGHWTTLETVNLLLF